MVPSPPTLQARALIDGYRPGAWIPPTATIHRKELTDRLGGWRDYRELIADPESELWRRLHDGGARIEAVKRLTAVKFPAGLRRDVYRERPNHEQAAWLTRIRQEPDFEAVELACIAVEAAAAAAEPPFRALIGKVLQRSMSGVGRRFRGTSPRRRAVERIDSRRAFKGLATPTSKPRGEQ
jgi:hypothetical protein